MTYKILIVDDQPVYLTLIEKAFAEKPISFQIQKAINGREACLLSQTFMPHLILMDWEMPEMTGIEAIKKLKSSDKTAEIPIIMVSSRPKQDALPAAMAAGASDFLEKPFQKVNLFQKVEKALNAEMVA